MHRQTRIALSSCLVIAAVIAVLWEVHHSHREPPPLPAPPPPSARVEARASQPRLPVPAAQYSGNTNTHKFHRNACRYYSCTNCTARFATREEALAAGFRPCGTCDP